MANRAWGTTVITAFGTAAVVGTAQLGVAYGLTIMDWRRAQGVDLWASNMAWTGWLAAVATVIGTLAAGMVAAGRDADGVLNRLSAALAAGVGAAIIGPLVALPAKETATAAVPTAPFQAAAIGIVAGMAVALIALAARPVALNVYASVALIWVLALLSVALPLDEPELPVAQLGVWGTWVDATSALGERGLSGTPPLLIGSLLIGLFVAWVSRGNGTGNGMVAASGVTGPLLVTVAYLVAGPGSDAADSGVSAFLIGPYAAIAGLLGSVLVAVIRRSGDSGAEPSTVDYGEPPPRRDDDDTVYERIPASRSDTDPYVDDYTRALDEVAAGPFADDRPQPAREGEDVPPPPPASTDEPAKPSDETEDWVTGLKDDEEPPPTTRRGRGRGRKKT